MEKIYFISSVFWHVKITYSYREANMCVDALTNIGGNLYYNMVVYKTYPSQ
jgi:hypothetical protein